MDHLRVHDVFAPNVNEFEKTGETAGGFATNTTMELKIKSNEKKRLTSRILSSNHHT